MFQALFMFGKKKKNASFSFACRQAAWSWPCQALVSIIHEKRCRRDLLGSAQATPPRKRGKRGFISTHTAKLFCWEHCISLIIVLSVKWMRRNSWHNIMWQIQFGIDWQCEIHRDHVPASRTIRAHCGVICIGERRAFAGSNLLGFSDFGNLIAGAVERANNGITEALKSARDSQTAGASLMTNTGTHMQDRQNRTPATHTFKKKKKRKKSAHLLLTSWFFDPLMTCNIHTPSYWMFHYNCRDAAECIMKKHGADYLQNVYHLSCAVGFSVFLPWNVWPWMLLLCIPVHWKIKGNTIRLTSCA